ncbi:MAG: hydrogenase expression/formation protein [Candidatus Thiodiazotropha sp. (ex Notomyrtea botanica)]|nr:hydrogenase expression/formation protein [Candidatus Thiodiazotropha sp. (ex Notomyrtea botanica)]
MQETHIPVSLIGTGSQPQEEDGANLDILELPDEMQTFSIPEIADPEALSTHPEAMVLLHQLQVELTRQSKSPGVHSDPLDLTDMPVEQRTLIDQLLGEGEVSMLHQSDTGRIQVQESVLAGLWRIRYFDNEDQLIRDTIEVAAVPRLCRRHVFTRAAHRVEIGGDSIPQGVLNAPPLLAEINDKVSEFRPGAETHVINLTLLPQTEEDLTFLIERLGEGPLTVLSRGYGNCRITSTAVKNVWWVQYFNSQDKNILNTLEIGDVPDVAAAAKEDIDDSKERLIEIVEAYL